MMDALKRHWTRYLMEAWGLGTFMTGASLLTTLLEYPGSPVSHAVREPAARLALLGVGMGCVIAGIVYSPWGKKSGAHINPAVTWAFFRLGKIARADAVWYTLAQFAGALLAVQLMGLLIGRPYQHPAINHVVTIPGTNGVWGAFGAEFLISFLLMWVVLVSVNRKPLEKWGGALTGVLIMFYLAVETPWSGMSLNPARTFGSAFAAREWTGLWVYFISPVLAMLLAAEAYRRLQGAHLDGQTYPMEDKQSENKQSENKQPENKKREKKEEQHAETPATGSGTSQKGILS